MQRQMGLWNVSLVLSLARLALLLSGAPVAQAEDYRAIAPDGDALKKALALVREVFRDEQKWKAVADNGLDRDQVVWHWRGPFWWNVGGSYEWCDEEPEEETKGEIERNTTQFRIGWASSLVVGVSRRARHTRRWFVRIRFDHHQFRRHTLSSAACERHSDGLKHRATFHLH